jgi:hypothetical protein
VTEQRQTLYLITIQQNHKKFESTGPLVFYLTRALSMRMIQSLFTPPTQFLIELFNLGICDIDIFVFRYRFLYYESEISEI